MALWEFRDWDNLAGPELSVLTGGDSASTGKQASLSPFPDAQGNFPPPFLDGVWLALRFLSSLSKVWFRGDPRGVAIWSILTGVCLPWAQNSPSTSC